MIKKYSLVHLTDISCSPPKLINIAKKCGYDSVSLRIIPMGLKGEAALDIASDKNLFLDTKKAAEDTGISINDIENARIFAGVNIEKYEPSLEAAASLGIKHVLTNVWTNEKSYYLERFSELCELAAKYEQIVNVEFVTWSSIRDIKSAKELILESKCENVGIVIDLLHFYRSKCTIDELKGLPKDWFNYMHLCDCEVKIPEDESSLINTGRSERLYPGEGAIDIKNIVDALPNMVYGIEVPHLRRLKEYGCEKHAKMALQKTKEYFNEN